MQNSSGGYEALFEEMKNLVAPLHSLHVQAAQSCAPLVENIIRNQCRDSQHIEHTLDHLLDCACVPEGLALFKALCRYYYTLNPSSTADYVNDYRKMWGQEPELPMEKL